MKIILPLLALCFALNANAATYLLLSQTNTFAKGITNEAKAYADSITPVGANPTATIANTANNGAATTFMRSDASPALPATLQHYNGTDTNAILSAIGGAALASPAFTGNPTLNGQSIETQLTNKLDKTQGGNVAGTMRLTGTSSLLAPSTMTTAQKNALTPQAGDMVYDSDLGRAQMYDGAAWHSRMRLDGDISTTGAAFTLGTIILTNNLTTTVPLQINATNGTTTNIFEANSGGTNRWKIDSSGNLLAGVDNKYNIGAVGANRPKDITASGTVTGGGIASTADVTAAVGGHYYYGNRGFWLMSSDGVCQWDNNAGTGFGGMILGPSQASPVNVYLQAGDGVGTDKSGGGLTVRGGESTGTGAGGYLDIGTALSDESSGSTANAYSIRYHAKGKFVPLTHTTATTIETFSLPANKLRGGTITALCYATNSVPHLQALTSTIIFQAIAIGTTITGTISQVDGTTATDSGTLTCAYTLLDNGNNTFSIQANANSSLATPTERCKLVITGMSGNAATTITDP